MLLVVSECVGLLKNMPQCMPLVTLLSSSDSRSKALLAQFPSTRAAIAAQDVVHQGDRWVDSWVRTLQKLAECDLRTAGRRSDEEWQKERKDLLSKYTSTVTMTNKVLVDTAKGFKDPKRLQVSLWAPRHYRHYRVGSHSRPANLECDVSPSLRVFCV